MSWYVCRIALFSDATVVSVLQRNCPGALAPGQHTHVRDLCSFSHPDCTVGLGFTPSLQTWSAQPPVTCSRACAMISQRSPPVGNRRALLTTHLPHPAPKKAIYRQYTMFPDPGTFCGCDMQGNCISAPHGVLSSRTGMAVSLNASSGQ